MSKLILTLNNIQELQQIIHIDKPASQYFDCGRYEEDAKSIKTSMPPYRSMFFQIGLFTKGCVRFRVNEVDYTMSANTLFLCAPGTVLSYEIQEELGGYYLLFSPGFIAPNLVKSEGVQDFAFFSAGHNLVSPVNAPQVAALTEIFEKIRQEKTDNSLQAFDIINCYITILIINARRIFNLQNLATEALDNNRFLIKKFQELISLHLQQLASGRVQGLKSVKQYAEDLNIHPNYLNETVNKVLGKSASSFIQEKIILEALTLLRQTDLTVNEVANRLGFETAAHFSRFFKNKTTYSTSDYKKLYKL